MKPWVRLLIAVVVLAAVVAVLHWREKPAPAAPAAAPLVKVDARQVQRITIAQPGQPPVQLTRVGGSWKLVQPYAFDADPAAVTSLLDSLGNITGTEDVGPATNLAAFGLDNPSTVELGLSNGGAMRFAFGADTPTG